MLNRTFIIFLAIGAVGGAYYLGYVHGEGSRLPGFRLAQVASVIVPADRDLSSAPADAITGVNGNNAVDLVETPGLQSLLERGAWFHVQRWLADNARELTRDEGEQLLLGMQQQVNKYDSVAMRRVLQTYLHSVPEDISALNFMSDLQQLSGLRVPALETLFRILDISTDAAVIATTMQQARQIIGVLDLEFQGSGDIDAREAFWRHNSQRVPYSDYFRYQWAKALGGNNQYLQALRVLAETGNTDISQNAIEDLTAKLELAAQGLQFERHGDQMTSTITTANGLTLRLLVDTGANITSLSKRALRALSAQRAGADVQVHTAAGVVSAKVYTVSQFEVQGVVIENLRVLELPTSLPDLDGLLGVDVLNRLSIDPTSL